MKTFFLVLFFFNIALGAEEETVYVQPSKTELRAQPKMDGSIIKHLSRGNQLTVLKKEGIWYQVLADGKIGWVSKLFLSNHKPVGEAEMTQQLQGDKNLSKAARKRASSYSAAATSRGLAGGNRVREGRENYQADHDSVQKLDQIKVNENELRKFKEEGKLNE